MDTYKTRTENLDYAASLIAREPSGVKEGDHDESKIERRTSHPWP
jgi:hypothetical protein